MSSRLRWREVAPSLSRATTDKVSGASGVALLMAFTALFRLGHFKRPAAELGETDCGDALMSQCVFPAAFAVGLYFVRIS